MAEGTASPYELSGGELCLDFANTVGGSRYGIPHEYMPEYADLLRWSQQTGLITPEQESHLQAEASRSAETASQVYRRAVDLREAIFRIFSSLAAGLEPLQGDVELLNKELSAAAPRQRLDRQGERFEWVWSDPAAHLDSMLGPVTRSAADLLASPDLRYVHQCGGDNCSWLFVDRTKNHSRVWCDMKSCGNRAKVRRHRAKDLNLRNS